MKTIYLIFIFLMLIFGSTGCGKTDMVVIADNENGKDVGTSFSGQKVELSEEESSSVPEEDYEKSDCETSADYFKEKTICVFVCGYVETPGVYELEEGSRICDALQAAGGIRQDGRYEALDQAKQVTDGQTIYVPGLDEEWSRQTEEHSEGVDKKSDGLININSAGKEELMTLPGIGESKAEDIISYREEHGGFYSIEEIMNIQGIKEGIYNKIKARISV